MKLFTRPSSTTVWSPPDSPYVTCCVNHVEIKIKLNTRINTTGYEAVHLTVIDRDAVSFRTTPSATYSAIHVEIKINQLLALIQLA